MAAAWAESLSPPPPMPPNLTVSACADMRRATTSPQAGHTVIFAFTVTNTGAQTLTGVRLDASAVGTARPGTIAVDGWTPPAAVLAPGQTMTASVAYRITPADIAAGHVIAAATARGEAQGGDPANPGDDVSGEGQADFALDEAAHLSVSTALEPASTRTMPTPGATITLVYTVTNTGNAPVADVVLADSLLKAPPRWAGSPVAIGGLRPGERAIARGVYTLNQADIDAGTVVNVAQVRAEPPGGSPADPGDDVRAARAHANPVDVAPHLTVIAARADIPTRIPDTTSRIAAAFTVVNTGNTTIRDITLTGPLFRRDPVISTWPRTEGVLRPGERVTATGRYVPTQTHIDAGTLVDTVVARGERPGGSRLDSTDDVIRETRLELPLRRKASLNLVKVGETSHLTSPPRTGQIIAEAYVIANNGNTTLTDVTLTDPPRALTPIVTRWPGAPGVLAPGQTVKATLAYRITQADIDAGHLATTPVASAERPGGNRHDPRDDLRTVLGTTIPLTATSTLTLSTATDLSGVTHPPTAGQEIVLRYTVSNTGNTTLTDVAVTDPLLTSPARVPAWPGAERVLLPGQSVTATGAHTLRDAEIDTGSLATIARADGDKPGGNPANPADNVEATQDVTVDLRPAHGLDLVAAVHPWDPALVTAGRRAVFALVATNTGNQPLYDVTLSPPTVAPSSVRAGDWPSPASPGVLRPGEKATWIAVYQIAQADVDMGTVAFMADVAGRTTEGVRVLASAEVHLRAPDAPELTLTAAPSTTYVPVRQRAGQPVTYTYQIANTGSTTVTGVRLTDPALGAPPVFGAWPNPAAPGVLAPGERVAATG
ncbi:MAG: hypothetical protein LBK72_06575, partial [Bifidobacteriaceae bacterium]|nr:hypothetical protein [Bifidobacteriaceae bacterium]